MHHPQPCWKSSKECTVSNAHDAKRHGCSSSSSAVANAPSARASTSQRSAKNSRSDATLAPEWVHQSDAAIREVTLVAGRDRQAVYRCCSRDEHVGLRPRATACRELSTENACMACDRWSDVENGALTIQKYVEPVLDSCIRFDRKAERQLFDGYDTQRNDFEIRYPSSYRNARPRPCELAHDIGVDEYAHRARPCRRSRRGTVGSS